MTDSASSTSFVNATTQSAALVKDNPQCERFELEEDGSVAYASYQLQGQTITFTHTFVPISLRGRGIATKLIVEGLASSRARSLQVIPICPVFRAYMKVHAETHGLLSPEGLALIAE